MKFRKKPNFIITIRYEIPTFSLVGPFFEEGGGGLGNFGQKLKFLGFFSIEVAPYKKLNLDCNKCWSVEGYKYLRAIQGIPRIEIF